MEQLFETGRKAFSKKAPGNKTGTSEEFAEAWYISYTLKLSTAVWVGYPEGRTPMLDGHGKEVVNG